MGDKGKKDINKKAKQVKTKKEARKTSEKSKVPQK